MAVAYEKEGLGFSLRDYPRGCVAVMDANERIHIDSWPEDGDTEPLALALLPVTEDEADVSPVTARALNRENIAPHMADCVERMVEEGFTYSLELRFVDGDAVHYASISEGVGSEWRVIASASDADYSEVVAIALLKALATRQQPPKDDPILAYFRR